VVPEPVKDDELSDDDDIDIDVDDDNDNDDDDNGEGKGGSVVIRTIDKPFTSGITRATNTRPMCKLGTQGL
jgi:hypothetical protein